MVPRGSLPAMTSALEHPGTGFLTTWLVKDSHLPLVPETSMALDEMSLSMTVECPMVPAMMTTLPASWSAYAGPVKLDVPVVEYCRASAMFHPKQAGSLTTVLFMLLTGW